MIQGPLRILLDRNLLKDEIDGGRLKCKLIKYAKDAPKGMSPETYVLVRATIDVLKESGDERVKMLEERLRRLHGDIESSLEGSSH